MSEKTEVHILIVAAGKGVRAGGGVPKQYRPIGGIPVLKRTLAGFSGFSSITLVIGPGQEAQCREVLGALASTCRLIPGGDSRQASVRAGLEDLAQRARPDDIVLVHDGARPFAPSSLIQRVIDGTEATGSALPGLPIVDTVKRVGDGDIILDTVAREPLRRGQTPQGFRFGALLSAHRENTDEALATDDSILMESRGQSVTVVPGDSGNVKLTTEDDFMEAEIRLASLRETRTGMGFDVHRFTKGDHVWLCGIKIPHSQSLAGHSDADVGLHAITDALLGALAAGDIGAHFPPSEARWKGCESHVFLTHAAKLLAERGGRLLNIDATLICEHPKVGPHRDAMRTRVAEILNTDRSRVSVKATTTEKLGFTGRGEGIACQAIATISVPGGEVL